MPKKHDDSSVLITQGGESTVIPFHSMLHPLEDNNHFSIWVSGLCSFSGKKSYGYLARKLLQAQRGGDPHQLLSVYNTGFGEIFAVVGDAPEWEEVYKLRSTYSSGDIPDGGRHTHLHCRRPEKPLGVHRSRLDQRHDVTPD
ncbi:phage terminase large subunit family protein [Vibrio sp. M60_M31a]